MISLTNLGLTPDPLVHNMFAMFICILMILLVVLVFLCLTFLHQQESSPKVVKYVKYFCAQIPCFLSKSEIQFYIYIHGQTLPCSPQPL